MDPVACQADPAGQCFIFRKRLQDGLVGPKNVFRVAGKGDPAKRPSTLAKQRTDVLRYETGDAKGIINPGLFCVSPNIVAVVERDCSTVLELTHRTDVNSHR